MTLQPLLDASTAIQIHVAAAVLAFLLGGYVLFARKGGRRHRMAGMAWVMLMVIVCVSSFFIHMIRLVGPWSPIHLLSVATLAALVYAIAQARRRNIVGHQRTMQGLYLGALIGAGSFTFLPGRIMHEVMLGGPRPELGVAVAVAAVAAGAWVALRARMRPAATGR